MILKAPMVMKGLISTLYDATLSLCSPSDQTLVTIWSQDLKVDLSDLWDSILSRVHSSSVCARHGVIQCKLLQLHHIYSNIDPLFNKYRQIMVPLCTCFGPVHPCTHTGFLYFLISLMYFKRFWSHVHSWPNWVFYQIPLN